MGQARHAIVKTLRWHLILPGRRILLLHLSRVGVVLLLLHPVLLGQGMHGLRGRRPHPGEARRVWRGKVVGIGAGGREAIETVESSHGLGTVGGEGAGRIGVHPVNFETMIVVAAELGCDTKSRRVALPSDGPHP